MTIAAEPEGLVAVLRGDDPTQVEAAARALIAGGIKTIEITLTVPAALQIIESLTHIGYAALVGAGTITTVDQARHALDAGARFIVSPACLPELVDEARREATACILGAATPTEVLKAWNAGANQVKVFPIGRIGGPAYLRDLAGPFPSIKFMPSGGIAIADIELYRLPNVASIALGSELAPAAAMARGDWDEIRGRAERAVMLYG